MLVFFYFETSEQIDLENDVQVFLKTDKKRKPTSYAHGRKLAVNVLSNISSLPFHVIVFRAGWIVKNLHSAFDYIFNSDHKDDSCAHVLAGWLEAMDSVFQGGFTPCFDSIKTEPEKAKMFLNFLFLKQKDYVNEEVLKLLLASILRFYQECEELLSVEPNNKFKGKNKMVNISNLLLFY